MSKENKALFTIGQFAALHGINKKTLMWYDEIGLFKPAAINEENGYRYYNYYQSSVLETILMLRDMKVSLDDIRGFMSCRSAASMKDLLEEKIAELDENIANLKAIRSKLSTRHEDMSDLLRLNLEEISIVSKEPRYLVTVKTFPDNALEQEIEMVIAQTKKFHLPRMYSASYGSMLPVSSLYERKFDDYSMLFIEIPNVVNRKGLHKQPGGKYLQVFCEGSWDKLPLRYEALLQYAERNHLKLSGFAYEIGINEMVINTMSDYITKIEIPILEEQ